MDGREQPELKPWRRDPERDWIVDTVLDVDAPRWAWEAAMRAACPEELGIIERELWLARTWLEDEQRDIRGRRAHLAEQYPALRALDGGGEAA